MKDRKAALYGPKGYLGLIENLHEVKEEESMLSPNLKKVSKLNKRDEYLLNLKSCILMKN